MTKPIDPQAAVEALWKIAPEYAQAKADRVYLEEFRKTKKALLMKTVADLPLGAQEREAYANPEYVEVLEGLRAAVEKEETLRWRLLSTQLAVEVWRSQESSNRVTDKATR